MKRLALAVLLSGALCPCVLAEEHRHSLLLHPVLSIPISGMHLSYEATTKSGYAGFEIPVYIGYNEFYSENGTLFSGAGLGLRRYLYGQGRGTYVSPQAEAVFVRRFAAGPETAYLAMIHAVSLRMGYKFLWEHITLDLGLGVAYLGANVLTGRNSYSDDLNFRLLTPSGNLAVGIPF